MSYSYAMAKALLSEGEKDRILAMWLSNDDHAANVDWDKATQAFGAASIESMRVSYRNLLKKIEKAGGKTGVTAPSTTGDSSAPPKTPKGKGGRPRKRKAESAGSDDDENDGILQSLRKKVAKNAAGAEEDEDEDDDAPKSLRKKAAKNTTRAENDDDDDEASVKTPKKPGRPRKTPVKATKKTAVGEAGTEEDMAHNINVASDKVEPDQDDEKLFKTVKQEEEDSEV
ncbi:hypothetical protein D6C91_01820 [Aureobasidium pullulans]|uniref:Myb-like domain-containing protein n=1 Tax=Aureobasidium pullulans TaxID=5580 RepID=A0A4S9TTJ6_AURPU|nr:hypothetical protein D6C91_01820 [Aureobasidium pullulans]